MPTSNVKKAVKQAVKKQKAEGAAEHTQDSALQGLPGAFARRIKVVFLGAGSFFTPRVLCDILKTPGQIGGTFALVDTDARRLQLGLRLVRKLLATVGAKGWTVTASVDRKEVLQGADYVINCIEVSGAECVGLDNDIPLRYGVDQCVGDTIGPGGLFKALRTIPAWIDILKDCERFCPQALVVNYTNPMTMLCTAAARVSTLSVVGLCHSVQGTSNLLASYAGVPPEELVWECAGINHLAWFTKLEHRGKDLYPSLKKDFSQQLELSLAEYDAGKVPEDLLPTWAGVSPADRPKHHTDLVRKHMCVEFGAFITESSGHLSEYLPYYRKSADGRKYLRSGFDGGSRFYATNWPGWREANDRQRQEILDGKAKADWNRSWEYASWIIEAREKNSLFRIHGSVMNQPVGGHGALISNLPAHMCVEVACLVDGNGVQPIRHGVLPARMAALCASNLSMFDLAVQAAVDRSIETAIHALMLDPLTAAICTPSQIRSMALEMFAAEKKFLPGYR